MRPQIEIPDDLHRVVTLQEAAWMWCRDPKGIMLHIFADHIRARQSKKIWLLTYADLVRQWGEPVRTFRDDG